MQITESSRELGSESGRRLAVADGAAWLLVAACPVLFAVATWPIPGWATQDTIRHFSLPIIAIETIIVLVAFGRGFQLDQALLRLPAWSKTALAVLIAVAVGTAVLVAADTHGAVARTCSSIIHVLFALALVHLFETAWRPLVAQVWVAIALGTMGFGLVLGLFVSSTAPPETFEWPVFYLAVTNARQLGFYSVVGACAAFGVALGSSDHRRFLAWLAIASAMLGISFWSGTRSSIVAFVAAFAIGARLFPALRRAKAMAGMLLSLFGGLAIGLASPTPHPMFGPLRMLVSSSSDDPGSGRTEIWLGTLRVFRDKPLFGYGESQFRLLVPEVHGAYNHPHNWMLQILFQWGLVGAFCYFALAALVWIHFERSVRDLGDSALPAYLVAISLLVYALYEGTLYHPYPIAMLALAITWAIAAASRPNLYPLVAGTSARTAADSGSRD